MRRLGLCGVGLLVVALVGCKHDGNVVLDGKVTVNGVPLESGEIRFTPIEEGGQPVGAIIKGGAYQVRVSPGRKTVLVTGYQKVGERPAYKGMENSPMLPITKRIAEETLTYEVATSATKDFELKTK